MTTPLFYGKELKYSRAKDSPFMKRLMQNEKISKILQKPEERESFYRKIKEIAARKEHAGKSSYSANLEVVREALYELKNKGGDKIESNEAAALARELVRVGPKFVAPKKTDHYLHQKSSMENRNMQKTNESPIKNLNAQKRPGSMDEKKNFSGGSSPDQIATQRSTKPYRNFARF